MNARTCGAGASVGGSRNPTCCGVGQKASREGIASRSGGGGSRWQALEGSREAQLSLGDILGRRLGAKTARGGHLEAYRVPLHPV